MSIFGSYVLGTHIPVQQEFMDRISQLTTWCLTAAMVGLGLNVSLHDLRQKALRPLAAMLITSVCLSLLTYLLA